MLRRMAGLVAMVAAAPCLGVPYSVELVPEADAFVRSMDPSGNYGGAGGLSVSGAAALNRQGQQMGTLDTWMRFALADLVAEMNAHFGGQPWEVQSAVLHLTEQGAPNNPVFNRGLGQFEVRWIEADGWPEGTGTPKSPTNDGVSFADEAALLNPNSDVALGIFANAGLDGDLSFELDRAEELLDDIAAGDEVSLLLTAAGDSVGFTFNSKDIGAPRLPPRLEITAELAAAPDRIPEPGSLALVVLGLAALAGRKATRPR